MEIVDADQVWTVNRCNTEIKVHKDGAIEYISGNEYRLAIDELHAAIKLEKLRDSFKDKE